MSAAVTFASPIGKAELSRLGQIAFQQRAASFGETSDNIVLKDIQFLGDDPENPLLAVLNFNCGFLVMSGDDAATPVLAYSFSSNLDVATAAPGALFWMELYKSEIQQLRINGGKPTEEIAAVWAALSAPTPKQNRSVVVGPLLTAEWNQTKYYNKYSPVDTESPGGYDNRTPNGCVAVAMAMIMYYYRYPIHGYGSHTNYTDYGNFTVNFSQQTYNYDAMEDVLNYYNDEVAKLIFHCATAVDMMYAADGSGAYSQDVPDAARQYFGYSSACNYKSKYHYGNSEWAQMLRDELDEKKPLYYSGSSEEGGHAFVCDGYDSDNKFHFNFGWGGTSNGFFALSASDTENNPVGGYSGYQSAVFDFYPSDSDYPYFCDSKVIRSTSGTLEDGSSVEDYQNNSHCTYIITDDQAYRVNVDIQYLETELNRDTLTFWDGHPQNGLRLLTLSGSTPTTTSYMFDTDSLYITFDTDESNTAAGWRLHYAVDRNVSTCHPEVINNQYFGTITDGSDADAYGSNLNCMWKIRVMDRERITFTFSELGISPEDELRIYNLKIQPKEQLASFSGSEIPAPMTFESNYIEVVFITDNYLNSDGFTAFWTTETEDGSAITDYSDESLVVYPNPANENLNLQLPYAGNWNLSVLDFSGRLVGTESVSNSNRIQFHVGDLSNGIYFAVCQENGKVIKQKFVVAH